MPVPTPRVRRSVVDAPPAQSGVEAPFRQLRRRLIEKQSSRGPCPRFSFLKADALPSPQARSGAEERAEHVRLCDLCESRLRGWRSSWEHSADQTFAWSRLLAWRAQRQSAAVLRGVAGAVQGLARTTRHAVASVPPAQPRPRRPQTTTLPRAGRRPRLRMSLRTPPLVVLEGEAAHPSPETLAAAVESCGGRLAIVPRIEEVLGDGDWKHVRLVLLARPRPLGEWREVLDRVEGRRRKRRVFALVPPDHLPLPGVTRREHRAVPSPLTEELWARLLREAGWVRRELA